MDAIFTAVTSMSKTTFYFIITVLILIDRVMSRYQKKINQGPN
jgi:hypothetical protein